MILMELHPEYSFGKYTKNTRYAWSNVVQSLRKRIESFLCSRSISCKPIVAKIFIVYHKLPDLIENNTGNLGVLLCFRETRVKIKAQCFDKISQSLCDKNISISCHCARFPQYYDSV